MDFALTRLLQLWSRILQLLWAAAPQVAGLVAQIIIIKWMTVPEVALRLPTYNFAISATSIVFMGLAYRQNRFVPSYQHILTLQGAALAWSMYFSFYEDGRGYVIAGLCVSVLASVSIILLQMLARFTRPQYLIGATILSAAVPNILWLDLWVVVAIAVGLLGVTMKMAKDIATSNEQTSYDFGQSLYSIALQIPLLSLTLFDPMIAKIMGLQAYVDYAILLKIANGVFLLLFSHLQLNILQNDNNNINLRLISFLSFVLLILISIISMLHGTVSVFVQCCILSLIINLVSIIVRIHLRFENAKAVFALFTLSVVLLYSGTTYSLSVRNVRFENYAAVIAAFIVVASLPLLWRAARGIKSNVPLAKS
ncbi:hypothetical protein LC612_29830 [Nostoc sp. CHAB 5834]|nr:hypothetical protein [Nostoc sp. CHAB 5834]